MQTPSFSKSRHERSISRSKNESEYSITSLSKIITDDKLYKYQKKNNHIVQSVSHPKDTTPLQQYSSRMNNTLLTSPSHFNNLMTPKILKWVFTQPLPLNHSENFEPIQKRNSMQSVFLTPLLILQKKREVLEMALILLETTITFCGNTVSATTIPEDLMKIMHFRKTLMHTGKLGGVLY